MSDKAKVGKWYDERCEDCGTLMRDHYNSDFELVDCSQLAVHAIPLAALTARMMVENGLMEPEEADQFKEYLKERNL